MTRIILPEIRALCARVRTKDLSLKMNIFLLFYARTLLLLVPYYYYYYYLRSTCMYICKVVCLCVQLSRRGSRDG